MLFCSDRVLIFSQDGLLIDKSNVEKITLENLFQSPKKTY